MLKFDIESGRIIDDTASSVSSSILHGVGEPDDSIGNAGDFYIETESWQIYQKGETWGGGVSLIGAPGEDGLPGNDGLSVIGKDGVGISDISLLNGVLTISLSDSETYNFNIDLPTNGSDGVGILSIDQSGDKVTLKLSDGRLESFTLLKGSDAREIELQSTDTHVRWRRIGDSEWVDLYAIPKGRTMFGGGGRPKLVDLTAMLVEGTNITITPDLMANTLTFAASGSGAGHTVQDEGIPLTARANLNFVGAGVTASDDSGNNATVVTIPGITDANYVHIAGTETITGAKSFTSAGNKILVSNTNTTAMFAFEQGSTGDATVQFIRTGVRAWAVGLDASDSNSFRISAQNDGFATPLFTMTTAGVTTFASTVTAPTFIGALTGNSSTATSLATGRTISITGDVTYTSPAFDGTSNITAAGILATVNSNVGSFGSGSQVGTFTVNGKGLITAASNTAISITSSATTDFTEAAQDAVGAMIDSTLVYVDATPLLTRAAITGDISIPQASNVSTLATVNSNVGSFTNANITVNAKGLITAASNGSGGGGSPGGSSGQLQYNNTGAFDGTAAVNYLTSGSLLTVTSQTATDKPLILKGATSQSGNLLEFQNSSGTALASMNAGCTVLAMQRPMVIGGGTHGTTSTTQATAIGYDSKATASYGTAIGDAASVSGSEGVAIGVNSSVSVAQGTAIGTGATAQTTAAGIAIGRNAVSNGAIVIGTGATASTGQVLIGVGNTLSGLESSVIGGNSSVVAPYSVGIGSAVSIPSGNNYSTAIGIFATVSKASQVVFATLGNTLLTLQRDSSTGAMRDMGGLQCSWASNTDATRAGKTTFGANYTTAFRDAITAEATSASVKLGFFATTPVVQPVNTTALDTLLVNLGLRASGGTANFDTVVSVKQGTSSSVAKVGGVIFDHYVDAGNSTTTETDLYADTIAVSALGTNGDKIDAEYGGIFVSSGTATRQVRIYFGGTAIFDTGALTLSLSSAWTAYVSLIRVSSTIIRYMISFATEGAALSAYTAVGELTGLTLSNTNVLKITGQAAGIGAATNDIVAKLGTVKWNSAA